MNKYLRMMIITFLVISLSSPVFSEGDVSGASGGKYVKVGAAGAQFLKIGIGARANAMGGAYSAVCNDLTSMYWNPAGLADIKAIGANFSYTQWFAGFGLNYGAIALPIGENFTTAFYALSFSSDRIKLTTMDQQNGLGSYTWSDIAVGATLAGYLTDQFSFGFTFKYIQTAFTGLNASGIAFDIGTMYNTGIQGIKLGFSINNLGTEQKFSGQDLQTTKKLIEQAYASPIDAQYLANSYTIPLAFRAGATTDIISDEDNRLLAEIDFIAMSDVSEQFALGAEYTWNNLLSIRGGYLIGQDQLGLSGGVGVNYIGGGFKGQIDYSINPTRNFGLVNRISIGMAL
ncbi:MAG: PorV/PorQ family protein, partial [Bacteroidetes bacterium]|nr:PorV/PorQ family protein [Bacteroidota bacterium]